MTENPKNSFQMGQIIYLLSEKAEKIVPAIVVEEVLVKKLDGNSVSWKVAVGPPSKRQEIDSNRLKGEIYCSLDEIRQVMTARLSEFVNNLVGEAQNRTESWYGKHLVSPVETSGGGKIDPASLMVDIDNGQNDMFINQPGQPSLPSLQDVKIKAAPTSGPLNSRNSSPASDKLRRKYPPELVDLATPTDEEMGETSVAGNDFVMGDNGRPIPIKYNIKE